MKKALLLIFLLHHAAYAQIQQDTSAQMPAETAGDDPSQFFTRLEFFNELQHHKNDGTDFYFNQTTLRAILKIGKRFTTRLDVPFVYNSTSSANYEQFGLSDISFRLLGYKFFQSPRSALTASIEVSLNTAASPLLGTGKNILIPMVSYSALINRRGTLLACVFQEAISFSGDDERPDISYSKLQPILLQPLSGRMWIVLAPELYIDYIQGGASMNFEARVAYAPERRLNVWAQAGAGLFGDFIARYQWSGEVGCRYFFLRNTIFKRKSNG